MSGTVSRLPFLLATLALMVAVVLVDRLADNYYLSGGASAALKVERGLTANDQLPVHWRPPEGSVERRGYAFELELNATDRQDIAIYFPAFQQQLYLYFNGSPVIDDQLTNNWSGPFTVSSALVRIPTNLVREGKNRLFLELQAVEKGFAYLYPFRVGRFEELQPILLLRQFFAEELPKVLMGALVVLAIIAVISSLSVSHKAPFLWLVAGTLPVGFNQLGHFSAYFDFARVPVPIAFGFIPLSGVAILAYIEGVEKKPLSRVTLGILGTYLMVFVPVMFASTSILRPFLFFVTAPLFFGLILYALFSLYRRYTLLWRTADLVLFLALLLMLMATIHDFLARLGVYVGWVILWGSFASSSLLSVLAGHLLWRGTREAQIEYEYRKRVEVDLRAKEAELENSFKKRQAATQMIALQNERSRILKELHDGVASQLVLISTIAQKPNADLKALRSIAQSALTDLRSVVYTLAIKNTDLLYVLALFREKYLKPLEGAGIQINWQLADAANIYGFSSSQALHLLRLLQEAATNSVKHAAVTNIAVSVEPLVNSEGEIETIVIHFEDEGEHSFEPNSLGLGIANMAARADQLNATIDFVPQQHGVRVDILLNVKNDPESGRLCLADSSPQYGEF